MNYLQLCNAVLRELNEVEITNVTSTRVVFKTAVADFSQQITERYNQPLK